ncbi:hypothetical protein C8Q73DRAFT_419304 [Cubamyces lactineus]|nr:hypothetical protein C8Q73DRAFT_419304 [Cubamyces lactineus]
MAYELPDPHPRNLPLRIRRKFQIDPAMAATLARADTMAKDNASSGSGTSTTSRSTSSSNAADFRALNELATVASQTAYLTTAITSLAGPNAALPSDAASPAVEHGPAQAVAEGSTTQNAPDYYQKKLAVISDMLLRATNEISSLREELSSAIENERNSLNVPSSPPPPPAPLPTDAAAVEGDESLVDMTNLEKNPFMQANAGGVQKGKASQRKRTAGRGKATRRRAR